MDYNLKSERHDIDQNDTSAFQNAASEVLWLIDILFIQVYLSHEVHSSENEGNHEKDELDVDWYLFFVEANQVNIIKTAFQEHHGHKVEEWNNSIWCWVYDCQVIPRDLI